MTNDLNFLIGDEDDVNGMRLDSALPSLWDGASRTQIAKAISAGRILLNEKRVKPRTIVHNGDTIRLDPTFFAVAPLLPEDISLPVLYEDEDLWIINKPSGLITHPTASVRTHTVVNALLASGRPYSTFLGEERLGIVHRLDAQTSGTLLLAKTDRAAIALQELFRTHEVHKQYVAIVEGRWETDGLVVDQPLGRHPTQPQKQAVLPDGREAHSLFVTREACEEASLMDVWITTGRTHQIRVHAAYCKHPVVGDTVYGYRRQRHRFSHHLLHAWKLSFLHPFLHKMIAVTAPFDEEFQRAFALYGFAEPSQDENETEDTK